MYAVMEQDSKQYKVSEGDSINCYLTVVSPEAQRIEINKARCQSCEGFKACDISDDRGDCIEIVIPQYS